MRLLRILAFPVSLVYGLVVHCRNFLFDHGILASQSFSTPLICIGNLSTGGTGKTPMVSFLVDLLGENYKMALLSRGYRRKSKGFVLADEQASVSTLGDEPFQLFKKHPSLTVAVDANRQRGISILERHHKPELILLDDAFQHRKVRPTISILLTSYGALYPTDWYLPSGNLRDAKNQARRAQLIIVTKCPKTISGAEKDAILKTIGPLPHQKVLFSSLEYDTMLVGKQRLNLNECRGKKLALVTGIAKPDPMVDYLKNLGLKFKHLSYADHHNFSKREVSEFSTYDLVITTEKDYVRMGNPAAHIYYLPVAHSFSDRAKVIIKKELEKALKPDSVPLP